MSGHFGDRMAGDGMSCNRGDSEKRALSLVKEGLFGTISANDPVCNSRCMFGFNSDEADCFAGFLSSLAPNANLSLFPDFVSPDGFIEHFRVSASSGKGGGSKYFERQSEIEKQVEGMVEELYSSTNEEDGLFSTLSAAYVQPDAKYWDFANSFKRSWRKHMESRSKYLEQDASPRHQAFLVEMSQFGLEMFEIINIDGLDDRCFGDLYEPEHLNNYRLSRDRYLLSWILENADGINYVIFLSADRLVEVIHVPMIPTLIKFLRWDYCIMGSRVVEMHSVGNVLTTVD